jgi:type IV pilus assembly protein PilA
MSSARRLGLVKSLINKVFDKSVDSAQALQPPCGRAELLPIRKAQGFALIDVIFVCGVIGVLASIALPRLLLAKQTASSASAIGSLRVIDSAELTYALTCGNGFYAPNLTTLGVPPPGSNDGFISPGLSTADVISKASYTIQLAAAAFPGAPATCNGLAAGQAGQGFTAGADPTEPSNSRFFATNATNVIYEDVSPLFPTMPETAPPASGHMIVR